MRRSKKTAKPKKTKNRVPIVAGVALIVIIVAIMFSSSPTGTVTTSPVQLGPPEFQDFVTEKSFVTHSDASYEYEVTRYASGATVTPEVNVGDDGISVGVSADPEDLNFGEIPIGKNNFAKRFIELSNLNSKEAEVTLEARGGVASFVTFSENKIILGPNEGKQVEVFFHTAEASAGEYTGEIDVIVRRSKFR